jgi:steroid delta-isomerase-like uncharacterized protein
MSLEENKVTIRRFMELGNEQDMEAIWESFDPQCRFPFFTRLGIAPTLEGYKPFLTAFFAALPDVCFTIEEMVAEGEKVWARINIRGTHQGLLRNVPATGKMISYTQFGMYRLAHGKIVEAQVQFDDWSLLQQLGVLPA